jgi:hypothetical protein
MQLYDIKMFLPIREQNVAPLLMLFRKLIIRTVQSTRSCGQNKVVYVLHKSVHTYHWVSSGECIFFFQNLVLFF